ncbi:RNA polymerase sigma factor [Pedobacter hartonius]|uniref:RNA polymerase sigma-70 factor, ECF subfamily n=1 Tax=Pedobacter hartonius TaxID=425514 RepID=A0A1H4HKN3_9SPHI|nr:RNA polymerase sigma-70 factor, ECF subfamily [Pedobacter hartonius]
MNCKKICISEKDLVQALKSQRVKGLEALYSMYSSTIFDIVAGIVKQQDAEDVTQEILIEIWNSTHKYDSRIGRFFTWILNVSRNCAIDVLRSRSFRNGKKNIDLYEVQNLVELKSTVTFLPC